MLTQATVAEGKDSITPTESQPTPSPTQHSAGDQPSLTESSSDHDSSQDPRVDLEGTGGSGGDQVSLPHDSPLFGGHTSDRAEGSLNLEVLSALCTNLSNRVLALETVKDAQAKEILTLKVRIKKLEKRLEENAKSGPTKDGSDKLNAELDEDLEYIDTEEALNEGRQSTVSTTRPDVSTARPDDDTVRPDVSTARQELSTAGPTTTLTTSTIFDDEEMTLANTLIKLKDDKAKGVAFKDSESTYRPARSILTLKPLPTIDTKDKGKGVLEEPESAKKMTKSDFDAAQIARYEEIARQLEVKLQAEVERERQREEQASMDYIENLYDEVQARIDAEHELAVRWTHEEQEKFIVDERAKLLAEYFERRKKQLGEERVAAIENKPPTKTQLRRLMTTYLKNMDFVLIGLEEDERMIRDINKKAEEESSDKDPDEEGVIDYKFLDKRFLIIKWESKFYHYDKHGAEGIYYRIFRSDGSSRWIKTFSEMVTRFDRLDLVELYNLVMKRFNSTTPEEDGTEIHMLLKRRYPLTTRSLERMLSLRLIVESTSDVAYGLLIFIQKKIDESGATCLLVQIATWVSELTFIAGSELDPTSYRLFEEKTLANCEQELCAFGFLLASSQVSSNELHAATYKLIEDTFLASCEQELCALGFLLASCQISSSELRVATYMGKENGIYILQLIDHGPFELGTTRDTLGTTPEGGVLLGPERPRLPKDIYKLINHNIKAKAIWDNVKMLFAGSELTKEDRESQLYDEFERFKMLSGENINEYYVRFYKLVNDMRNIRMTMPNIQLNSKFVNNMSPELDSFVITVVVQNVQGRQNQTQRNFAWGNGAAGNGGAQIRAGNVNAGQGKPIKCFNCNRLGHITRNCTQPKHQQNSNYFKDKMLLMQAQENGVVLDEEELLFLTGEQTNNFDADMDDHPVRDLALNDDNIFQADECDAFDSDVDDEPTAQSIFMANLSSAGPTNQQASLSNASILSEVHDPKNDIDPCDDNQDEHDIHNEVQQKNIIDSTRDHMGNSNVTPYEQYLSVNDVSVVPSCESSISSDAYVLHDNDAYVPHDHLVTELNIYKEQVAIYEQRARFELTLREQKIDEQISILIRDCNQKEENLKKELHSTTSLQNEIENLKTQLKGKMPCVTSNDATPKVPACAKYEIDVQPIPPRQRNNMVVHHSYLNLLRDTLDTLCEIVEEARSKRPSDNNLDYACVYTKRSQELLENVSASCPKADNKQDTIISTTPVTRKNHVTFAGPLETSGNNPPKIFKQQTMQKTNIPILHSTEVSNATKARRSQPKSNTTNDRTLPSNSMPKKKVEDHHRKTKSKLSKNNRVDLSTSVRRTVFNINSNLLFKTSCSKHMTGDRSRLKNFVKQFIGTVRFKNNHFGAIMGYGDYVLGDSVISKVYYVEGLGHNIFSVGQFCDSNLEIAFKKHTCFVRYLDGVNLIKDSRGSNLYTISIEDMLRSSPICLLSKASMNKSWLWHRHLNHLNFGTINDLARKELVRGLPRLKFKKDHLCFACQLGNSRKATHQPKTINTIMEVLHTLHMDLCRPLIVQSINGKKYILVIVDDYSRFTWVNFLRSKDETPEFVVKLLKQLQVGLNKIVRHVQTDNGTEFVNKDLTAYY
uniref:Retrovirus-related Pol polyprotein from transposon TNT 1-94 n=1 Tax=Tanacetum cinerariifolium TaxID=118510 RepID=A0A6L2KNK8_TANCI|nr:retrovirus-related Pol polyprotein from transposon TNT 1-94 [Tanacetum cinerariifolium]